MTSFIDNVISDLNSKGRDISEQIIILPNKRAGLFLKKSYSTTLQQSSFTPLILSIEEFIEEIAGITYADNLKLIFKFYDIYKDNTPADQLEPFENVMHWSNMLIQDFNNIDRYLIEPENIFDYLSAIKDLDHWSQEVNKSESVINYLNFWKSLKLYYNKFKSGLLSEGIGYQGMVYRKAVKEIDRFISQVPEHKYVFIGFNALNKAEEIIVQKLLTNDLASIYWDADSFYLNDNIHDAGHFLRIYKKTWPFYNREKFTLISNDYSGPKNIKVVGTPKNIGQVKYAGNLLKELQLQGGNLDQTAVVLADETLLLPLLNSLPDNVGPVNVTMGVPLEAIPLTSLFETLFKIHKTSSGLYHYKDVIAVLDHPVVKHILKGDSDINIIKSIQKRNLTVLTVDTLLEIGENDNDVLNILFRPWQTVDVAITKNLELIHLIKSNFDKEELKDFLTLEYLYRFYKMFNEVKLLYSASANIKSISSLYMVFSQLLNKETLDFKGEPLRGLQIMGMLETRVLDFKNIIILSVNEGVLPAGKSENSFIPFDVKKENGMPTYKELDAVYTYHFYRLIQRAENIHIIYNSEPDVLNGGEKSRFINQMEIDGPHKIEYLTAAASVPIIIADDLTIKKTASIIDSIKVVASKGFSPSSLTNYMRNPMDFYYQTILGIDEVDEVEETVAANTMGTIIHDSLEALYLDFIGQILTVEGLKKIRSKIELTVEKFFLKAYKGGQRNQGKNLIVFETCKYYVDKFIKKEMEVVKDGHEIKIISLEEKLEAKLNIDGLNFEVSLKGKVDRVDNFNGMTRIIDYKTGLVNQSQVEIVEWQDLTTDYKKFSKSFQVLCYALLLNAQRPFDKIEAGIISFKNLKQNFFLKFAQKPTSRSKNKNTEITQETLAAFTVELHSMIKEICNPEIDFVEKEI